MKTTKQNCSFMFASMFIFLPICIRAEEPGSKERPSNVIEEFDVAKNGDLLIVPVTIEQKKYSFVLDTGSSTSVFDNSLRGLVGEKLGKWTGATATGNVTLDIHRIDKASLGKLRLHEGTMVALADLSWIAPLTGYDVRGILGMDCLGSHVVQINFDQGKLAFLRSPGDDPGVAVPLIIEDDDLRPMVNVNVPSWGTERFMLDTGAVSISGGIGKDLFVRFVRNGRIKIIGGGEDIGLAGKGESAFGRLDQIQVDEFKHADLIFGAAPSNILGLEYLSRYKITFDFPNRKMYLKKGQRFYVPDELDKSGMDLRRKEGKTIVEEVAEGSPAAEAGIRRNDHILRLGDKSADESSLNDIHRLLSSAGKEMSVQLRRDGQNINLALLLRDYASDNAAAREATLKTPENTLKSVGRTRGRLFGRRR